jgi:hypothetical protein
MPRVVEGDIDSVRGTHKENEACIQHYGRKGRHPRSRSRSWEENIAMTLTKIMRDAGNWAHLPHDKDLWWGLVQRAENVHV